MTTQTRSTSRPPTRILIVDDDTTLADALRDEVERMGFGALVADSADAALEVVLNSQVDVLLTDLRMAGRDGIELIKLVRQTSPETRTLLMSAFATAKDYKVATQHGALDVLTKPFTPEDLAEALRKAEDCEEGVQGTVHGLNLTDILQMFHLGRRSLIVKVGAEGAIHLREGEIVHATKGTLTGEPALLRLLGERSASVRTAPSAPAVERSIDAPFDQLLLDIMRRIDEAQRDGADLASHDFSDETPATLVKPPQQARRPDGAAAEVLRSETGESPAVGSGLGAVKAASSDDAPEITAETRDRRRKRLPSAAHAPVARREDVSKRSPAVWIVAVAAVAAAIFGVVCWIGGGDKGPKTKEGAGSAVARVGGQPVAPPKAKEADAGLAVDRGAKTSTPARVVLVSTKPPNLALVDAESKELLGRSPLKLSFAAGEAARQLRARRATYTSQPFAVSPTLAKLEVDLTGWMSQVRALLRREQGKPTPRRKTKPVAVAPKIVKKTPAVKDPPPAATPDPPPAPVKPATPAKPKLGAVDEGSRPKLGAVGDDKPKLGAIGDDKPSTIKKNKPKVGTID